ncbi:hypothetical protein [Oceanidesulfovibrio marinus]|nr:hypothetical protein [Oceanidesulfovibrio marinus]
MGRRSVIHVAARALELMLRLPEAEPEPKQDRKVVNIKERR